MKTKSIMLGLLSAMMLMASCSKEDVGGNASAPVEGVETYASFSVSINNPGTRAAANDANAVQEETQIDKVNIFIFSGGVLESKGTIQINTQNEGTTALKTTTGLKTIYAVTNLDVTGEVNSLQKAFEEQLINEANIAKENAFLMVGATETTLTEQTETDAVQKNNLIGINVSRAAAKVQMKFDNVPVKDVVNAVVSDAKYILAQQNKQTFLYRVGYDLTPNGGANQVDGDADGTFDHLNAIPANIQWKDAVNDWNHNFVNSFYLAENVNQAPVSGNTSFVLVEVKVTPTQKWDNTQFTNWDNTKQDFWVIATTDENTSTITFAAAQEMDGVNKILYFESENEATSYLNDNNIDGEVVHYTGGKSYYRLNIRDINKNVLTEKYAVLRNNYYKVNISEISNLGFNTPTGTVPTKPETPLETDTYISAEITIEPWTEVVMNEPLG